MFKTDFVSNYGYINEKEAFNTFEQLEDLSIPKLTVSAIFVVQEVRGAQVPELSGAETTGRAAL